MRHPSHWRLPAGIGVLAGALALTASGFAAPAFAQTGPVGTTPASGTPQLLSGKGVPFEQINVMKECGNMVYAGGTFTSISQGGNTITRDNLFSFEATAPYTVSSWNPDVDGNVQTLAFDGGDCSDIFIGGQFTSVDGTKLTNIAKVSTTTGAVDTAFGHTANAAVDTMAVTGSHLLVGGTFTKINYSTADPYYASLNIDTGKNDGYLDLNISGSYSYPKVAKNPTRVYDQQMNPAGNTMLVEGDFTSVGGQARQQAFEMTIGSSSATVNSWSTTVFNTHCTDQHPFYTWEGAWSPSGTEVYFATTGYHTFGWDGTYPLQPPCDDALAFGASGTQNTPTWTMYTGCYSLFSVVADSSAVYVAGHPQYADNQNDCKKGGPGSVKDVGLQGLNPSTGDVLLNSGGTAMYSMSAANADNMMLTSAGLWIASTNRFGSSKCDGVSGHSGICFLAYPAT